VDRSHCRKNNPLAAEASRTGFDNVSRFSDFGIQPGTQYQFAIAKAKAGAKDNPLKRAKNAIERLVDKLSNVWLFAGSWACDVESLHQVILQESVKPLSGILLAA
jgi:hypothetical protein